MSRLAHLLWRIWCALTNNHDWGLNQLPEGKPRIWCRRCDTEVDF